MVVVDARGEPPQFRRSERQSERPGLGDFGLDQLTVSLDHLAALAGDALGYQTVLRRRHAGILAGGLRRRGCGARAGIGAHDVFLPVRGCHEQLDQIRRADRSVERKARAHILDRRVLHLEFVGIGLARGVVVRIAVPRVHRQVLNPGQIMGERRAHLEEGLVDAVALVDRDGRAGKAGEGARELRAVGTEGHGVRAVLVAEVHPQRVVGNRGFQAVFAQVAGDVDVLDLLGVDALGGARSVQIVEGRLGHPARLEDVPRHALAAADTDRNALRVGRDL